MVNKYDKMAIQIFNLIIITIFACILFIVINSFYPLTKQEISFKELKESIKIYGGLKK